MEEFKQNTFNIKLRKTFHLRAVPVNIMKKSMEIHLKCLTNTINHSLT